MKITFYLFIVFFMKFMKNQKPMTIKSMINFNELYIYFKLNLVTC